jgi:hypothetical protein
VTPDEIVQLARAHAIRLSVNGDKLRVEADAPPPAELMAAIRQHKPALMKLLAEPWDTATADGWIEATLERTAGWHDQLARTCRIDGPAWDRHEEAVNAAYAAQDRQRLRQALEVYERFAFEVFMAHARGQRICTTCGRARWWTRTDGGQECGVCHPDPQPECRAMIQEAQAPME